MASEEKPPVKLFGVRKILFLSGLDFKERSIQVIRKTPEAYAQAGWSVTYIVAREMSQKGNYDYEPVIDPPGVKVIRTRYSLKWLRDRSRGVFYKAAVGLDHWLTAFRLGWLGFRQVRQAGPYDVIYGYESCGVLGAAMVRLLGRLAQSYLGRRWRSVKRRPQFISRFQGVWNLNRRAQKRQLWKIALQSAWVAGLYLPSDLCIMTNDGSQGCEFLRRIRSRNKNVLHLVNGVDPPSACSTDQSSHRSKACALLQPRVQDQDTVLLVVSRLVGYKRADRAIRVMARIVRDAPSCSQGSALKLVIVGGGGQQPQLEQLALRMGLQNQVVFTGPVPHECVTHFLQRADYFLSFYHNTNVGNPLLEAIRHHKIVMTLNNGDTGTWIQHQHNGLLLEENDDTLPARGAEAFWRIHQNASARAAMRQAVIQLAKTKLWTWNERFQAELSAVEALLNNGLTDGRKNSIQTVLPVESRVDDGPCTVGAGEHRTHPALGQCAGRTRI